MNLLLDTHVALWAITDDPNETDIARRRFPGTVNHAVELGERKPILESLGALRAVKLRAGSD